jgi:hypothetical protein
MSILLKLVDKEKNSLINSLAFLDTLHRFMGDDDIIECGDDYKLCPAAIMSRGKGIVLLGHSYKVRSPHHQALDEMKKSKVNVAPFIAMSSDIIIDAKEVKTEFPNCWRMSYKTGKSWDSDCSTREDVIGKIAEFLNLGDVNVGEIKKSIEDIVAHNCKNLKAKDKQIEKQAVFEFHQGPPKIPSDSQCKTNDCEWGAGVDGFCSSCLKNNNNNNNNKKRSGDKLDNPIVKK